MLKHQPERVGHALCGFCYCLDVPRAAEKEGGGLEKSFLARSAQKYSRRGQLKNGVRRMFVYANHESNTDYSTQVFTH